jgi:RNA polymerase sigma-70 factor (ECF subfamily)
VSTQDELLGKSPETLLVGLARKGDRGAFAELLQRRQAWIRNLLLRCCNNPALADDLAQQVFLQAWRTIHQLRHSGRFAAWLKRLAINTWLQQARKNDPLDHADDIELQGGGSDSASIAMDLDRALATLKDHVRLCIVLSYHEGMTHEEIAEFTSMSLGTVKSHIRRGTQRLQSTLAAYQDMPPEEKSS